MKKTTPGTKKSSKLPFEVKTEWNMSLLFASKNDPKMTLEREQAEEATNRFVNKWEKRQDYLTDPEVLAEALSEYEEWTTEFAGGGVQAYYWSLLSSLDQNDPAVKAEKNKINDFGTKLANKVQFFSLRVAKISGEEQEKFLSYAKLSKYRHYLERLFLQAKYDLSEPEEKIMNLKVPVSHTNWVRMLSGFLAKEEREVIGENGKKVKKTYQGLMDLFRSEQKKVRDGAAAALNDILEKLLDVGEAEINSVLQNKKINDEIRGFSRPDEARHIEDDIDTEVVDAMIAVVSGNNEIPKRYYKLKAKLLKQKKLAYHERLAPIGKVNKRYPFEDGVGLVDRVFGNLDSEFQEIFRKFLQNGQVDVYPKVGKKGGAFCTYNTLTTPTFVLLNHTNTLNNVTTIAHEFGHAINNEIMRKAQNEFNFATPLSTAEVASTFMEDFVYDEILKTADQELRFGLMMEKLDDFVSSIFRQVACYQFETDLHRAFRKQGYLAKEEIGKIFSSRMAGYMGSAVEMSKGSQNWWLYWSHIRTFFYVYSYASGLLISKSLQGSVKKDPKFIQRVKEFLSAGTSDSPKNIFGKMGIDIADKKFWENGISEIRQLLDETEKLAKKLGKI